MKASEVLQRSATLHRRAIPSLVAIDRSVDRILAQWPDVVHEPVARDREALARQLLTCVTEWSWGRMKTARILSAALAVFDEERRDRPDLEPARAFLIAEIAVTKSAAFLSGMAQVYLDTFDAVGRHTLLLARALAKRGPELTGRMRLLLASLPDVFDPRTAPRSLARKMLTADDPYLGVKALGFRSPHASGLTRAANRHFVKDLEPTLTTADARRKLFAWITPSSGVPLQSDAGVAVEALLRVWAGAPPPDDVRNEISEAILSAYNDPRTHSGGIWSGFDQELKAVFLRWLTKQDMLFFCDMVSATQDSHMWPPRRRFWLQLYEEGRIDEAWVAFGTAARDYARRRLLISGTSDINRRFGRQTDRGGSTSLLIMRIGGRIIVDGCHSYRTHIFRANDRSAPKLYQPEYHCDAIMRRATNSKSHSSISAWELWVNQNVG
ncbi:EH signature domain-containing protein [Oceaniglobus roseus]|uniref:EH signature domain-containing protein n=1 Tax=Oceaniglobus roseus TaxID=1737570 RepID=UPI000C7F7608|nr:EH signature domain-containing protein [Kandeliimicrobium roseum]